MQLEAGCRCCPCLKKPPEPQPTLRIALTSYSLTGGERARARVEAEE